MIIVAISFGGLALLLAMLIAAEWGYFTEDRWQSMMELSQNFQRSPAFRKKSGSQLGVQTAQTVQQDELPLVKITSSTLETEVSTITSTEVQKPPAFRTEVPVPPPPPARKHPEGGTAAEDSSSCSRRV